MGVDSGADGQLHLECIDMASRDKHATAARVREACMSSGIFYLVNHGVKQALIDEAFAQCNKFFALPLQEKEKVAARHDKNHRGYLPFQEEILDLAASKGDLKEGYYVGVHIPESDPRSKKNLHGPNQYPSPVVLPGWQKTMDLYHSELGKLAIRVCRLVALALNLEETYFEKPGFTDDAMAHLRPVHYSGEKTSSEQGIFACGAHCDWGLITLLMTDGVPGLQVCNDKGAVPQIWEEVPQMKGAYIVNLGDMLARWSNGLFCSPLHRVICQGTERYSIPFFFNPNYDCRMECLPTCYAEDNPSKFPPMTGGEYILSRVAPSKSSVQSMALSNESGVSSFISGDQGLSCKRTHFK